MSGDQSKTYTFNCIFSCNYQGQICAKSGLESETVFIEEECLVNAAVKVNIYSDDE